MSETMQYWCYGSQIALGAISWGGLFWYNSYLANKYKIGRLCLALSGFFVGIAMVILATGIIADVGEANPQPWLTVYHLWRIELGYVILTFLPQIGCYIQKSGGALRVGMKVLLRKIGEIV